MRGYLYSIGLFLQSPEIFVHFSFPFALSSGQEYITREQTVMAELELVHAEYEVGEEDSDDESYEMR